MCNQIYMYLLSSVKGLQNHLCKIKSKNPSLHFLLFGYSISSSLSTFSNRNAGSFLSSSVCKTTYKIAIIISHIFCFMIPIFTFKCKFQLNRLNTTGVWRTCIASRFSWAFLLTLSISPTAKPISKFIRSMGIKIMNKARIMNVGIGKGRIISESSL